MTGPIVVCGLKAEADIARGRDEVAVVIGGGNHRWVEAELDAASKRATAFLSFGVAGGLAPDLVPGDVRIAEAVIAPDGTRYAADPRWADILAWRLDAPRAIFAGVDAPLGQLAGKAKCHAKTGAAIVDMETHIVAACAAKAGLAFAAIRVVTDPATRALPHAAMVGMRADGKVDLAAVLRSLAKNPGQLPDLIRTGLDARVAFASLLRCRQRLGPNFALFDFGQSLLDVP